MLKAITINDDEAYLRQVSKEVDIKNDKELENDIRILEEFCKANEVMAMAAIQLGIPKRLMYLKNTNLDVIQRSQTDSSTEEDDNYNEARVLINPVIINREGLTEYWEACVSCLDNCGRVLRPYKIDLEYEDINGEKYRDTFIGFEATVLSHEFDHLNGVLHMDIAEEVLVMTAEERKVWRQSHDYKVFSETGNYEELKAKQKNYKK